MAGSFEEIVPSPGVIFSVFHPVGLIRLGQPTSKI